MNDEVSSASVLAGLSESEAQARLKREGYNELPRGGRRTPFRIVLEVMREPMLALLVGGGAVYLALGDLQEALILLAFAMVVHRHHRRAGDADRARARSAARSHQPARARHPRRGAQAHCRARGSARGSGGALRRRPRTRRCRAFAGHDLQADESLLTGESVPVRKVPRSAAAAASARPGGDDLPFVFSGALMVRGAGLAEVIATGVRSEIGKIGQSLSTLETEPPRLQAQTQRLVRLFALVGGGVSVLAVVLYGLFRGGWLDAVLAGIALGMSMLPEEFPVVLTVFMAMGAWRISRARVLTRRASAIETLGSATVLCTDKTGTLTLTACRLPNCGSRRAVCLL